MNTKYFSNYDLFTNDDLIKNLKIQLELFYKYNSIITIQTIDKLETELVSRGFTSWDKIEQLENSLVV